MVMALSYLVQLRAECEGAAVLSYQLLYIKKRLASVTLSWHASAETKARHSVLIN